MWQLDTWSHVWHLPSGRYRALDVLLILLCQLLKLAYLYPVLVNEPTQLFVLYLLFLFCLGHLLNMILLHLLHLFPEFCCELSFLAQQLLKLQNPSVFIEARRLVFAELVILGFCFLQLFVQFVFGGLHLIVFLQQFLVFLWDQSIQICNVLLELFDFLSLSNFWVLGGFLEFLIALVLGDFTALKLGNTGSKSLQLSVSLI